MPGVKDTASRLSHGNTQPRLRTSIRLEDIALMNRTARVAAARRGYDHNQVRRRNELGCGCVIL